MRSQLKWAAELSEVREVSLRGTADLRFWQRRLMDQGLSPAENEGRAQILIVAAGAKFRGIRFSELSVSVLVSSPNTSTGRQAAYLLHAFNSNGFFAFCERVFFATPYSRAQVNVTCAGPASVEVRRRVNVIFAAAMKSHAGSLPRTPERRGEDGWEGPVFLPGKKHVFFARVRGETETYRFDPAADAITIGSAGDGGVLSALTESGFVPRHWELRASAVHAKSKTYRTDRMPGIVAT